MTYIALIEGSHAHVIGTEKYLIVTFIQDTIYVLYSHIFQQFNLYL